MKKVISLIELISPWLRADKIDLPIGQVHELVLDSRQVKPGDTFVAIIGHQVDGRQFITKAIDLGASSVLAQADKQYPHGTYRVVKQTPIIYIDDLSEILSPLAARLYQYSQSKLIAITGTNGKTTVSQLITQWLGLLNCTAAVMGTTGNGFLGDLQSAQNTTGSAIDIQRTLSDLADADAQFTTLEVSSHGLVQGRVKSLEFSAGVFTNLSRDHLDYHGTMEEYALAKKQLFATHQCQHLIINVDDQVGLSWMGEFEQAVAVSLYPQTQFSKAIWATDVVYSEQGIALTFDGYWGYGELQVGLIGQFNASNVLVTLATLLSLGFDKSELLAVAEQLKPVLGRMELFQTDNKAKVVVDYAHTPDALEKALKALRVHCHGKLWAIFGCGGNRDKGKRPMMASIGEQLADHVILTDDNPRNEDPNEIVKDMLAGLTAPEKIRIEHDRFAAVDYALQHTSASDIILLAGKGHEDYQIFADQTVHFSDRETALQLLGLTL